MRTIEFALAEEPVRFMLTTTAVGAKRFQDLETWQLGRDLRKEVYRLSASPAFAREFGLRDQLKSSAASICANIAEGFGRRSHADFARFLTIANGSIHEVQNHLSDAHDRGILSDTEMAAAFELADRTCAAVAALAGYLRRTPTPTFGKRP